jgi:hypothetical protein
MKLLIAYRVVCIYFNKPGLYLNKKLFRTESYITRL